MVGRAKRVVKVPAEMSGAKQSAVQVREATPHDITALVALNRAAYPSMAEKQSVWGESHLISHQRVFSQGQLVAELDGELVDAAASLIVNMGADPLRQHTWAGITDSGYFYSHDPNSDTLYGADIYVHPDARGHGIGAALYESRRQLCRRLNLRRILAGGRLRDYHQHADRMSPAEYAQRVAAGEMHDLVLSFQLHQGFVLRGILPNYLRDPHSLNNASLIEWLNPDYQPRPAGPRKVRVACVQHKMRKVGAFEDFARQVGYFIDVAAEYRSDFVLLPELFTLQLLSEVHERSPQEGMKRLSEFTPQVRRLLGDYSAKHGLTIIGGSHPVLQDGKLYNVAQIFLPDGRLVEQPKLHITPNERKWWGMSGGSQLAPIDTPKARIGVLICYDIEFPEPVRYLADAGAEIIFVPFCTDSRQSYLRVRICAHARAIENHVYVALSGNVGNLPDVSNMDVQYAQAAVLTPSDFAFSRDGIAAEADSNEETVLVCDLDLEALHRSRDSGTVTPRLDRRKDIFQFVAALPSGMGRMAPPLEGPLGDQLLHSDSEADSGT